jgi:hypothetical protein
MPLPAHRTPQTQYKSIQTSKPQVGFEPTIPVFERAKTVHALDGATNFLSIHNSKYLKNTIFSDVMLHIAYVGEMIFMH